MMMVASNQDHVEDCGIHNAASDIFLSVARAAADRETTKASGQTANCRAGTRARLFTYVSSFVSSLKPLKISLQINGQ